MGRNIQLQHAAVVSSVLCRALGLFSQGRNIVGKVFVLLVFCIVGTNSNEMKD
jgi:hypothetical protein